MCGALYNVANAYGKGLKETIYQKALAEELEKQGIPFEREKRIDIYSTESGKKLGTYIPDFVIDNKIVLEIKATTFSTRQNLEQQLSYLKASKYELGYLVNFSTPKLYLKRSIYTNDRKIRISTDNIRVNS
jgi:GxxExxY protein